MTEHELLALLDALAEVGCTVEQGFHEEGQLTRAQYDELTAYLADADEWRAAQAADDETALEPCGACGEPLDNPADPLRWNGTAVCRACFDAFLHQQAERFELRNDRPMPKPWKPAPAVPKRQRMLLAGLDCLAGQGDLFATDGEG